MGKQSRDKGVRLEQEVVNILKAAGFEDAKRTGEYHERDIRCGIDGEDRFIEVKGREKGFCSLYQFLNDNFAVVHRADRKPWLITMEFEDWLRLSGPAL